MASLFPMLAVLIWAANTVVSKAAASVLDPAAVSVYRWLVALLVLSPFMWSPLRRQWPAIRPMLPRFAVLALLGAGNPLALLAGGVNGGDALMLLGSAIYALYGILFKRLAPPFGQWLNLYVQVGLAVLMLTPLASTAH